MAKQSISITTPNDEWLNVLVANDEYKSKSEIVNDLIRKARAEQNQLELIRARLIQAENSGFTNKTAEEMLVEFKKELTESFEE